MPDHPDHIDLVTLQQIEELLATTKFASIEDLADRGGFAPVARALAPAGASRSAAPRGDSEGLPPLPRRR